MKTQIDISGKLHLIETTKGTITPSTENQMTMYHGNYTKDLKEKLVGGLPDTFLPLGILILGWTAKGTDCSHQAASLQVRLSSPRTVLRLVPSHLSTAHLVIFVVFGQDLWGLPWSPSPHRALAKLRLAG